MNEVETNTQVWMVDTREPDSIKRLFRKYNIPYVETTLPLGDMVLGDIVIERKTVIDLANSVTSGRIWHQLKELERVNGKPILLVELTGHKYWKHLNHLSSISAYCAKHGIYVIAVHNRKALANTLKNLMNGGRRRSISLKKRWKGHPIQYVILAQFPNIGIAKARELIHALGTLRDIFNADEETLSRIVGKVTARKFIEVLDENINVVKQGDVN